MTSPLPRASLENEFLRLDYLTTTGPRIIGLHAKGVEGNLLAETPDVHWSTPHGEYYLRGGHRLWISPEDAAYICPEGNVEIIVEPGKVTLRGEVDAARLEKEISFRLEQNRVLLTHKVTWHGREPIELAPWSITQVRLGGMAILPLSTSGGLLPNRNIVLWQYSRVEDERFALCDDFILLHGRASNEAFKIGNYNSHGWIACLWDNALFVKRFSVESARQYSDLGSNVEAYVRDTCLELENLGPLRQLQPNESATLEETWEVSIAKYSATVEDARRIGKQYS
jgi:hypothetical protein